MRQDGRHFEAIAETTSFLRYFNDLPDYRQAGKVDYPLPEVLLLILLAVLGGAEAFTDIARFSLGGKVRATLPVTETLSLARCA